MHSENDLELYSLEIEYIITESMTLPTYKGFKISGIMGDALRKNSCYDFLQNDCYKCSYKYDCFFADFFQGIKKDSTLLPERYHKYSTFPSQFSFLYPLDRKKSYQKNEIIKIQMNFLGDISIYFPKIIIMLENMKEYKPDYRSNGRFVLLLTRNINNKKIIYEKGKFYPENLEKIKLNQKNNIHNNDYRIEFITPTRIIEKGKHIMNRLNGDILTNRIYERVMLLLLLYTNTKKIPEISPKAIEIIDKRLYWKEYSHNSNRQKRKLKFGGFIGLMDIKINDWDILPILKLLEIMHLGSNAKAGFGRYRIASKVQRTQR